MWAPCHVCVVNCTDIVKSEGIPFKKYKSAYIYCLNIVVYKRGNKRSA